MHTLHTTDLTPAPATVRPLAAAIRSEWIKLRSVRSTTVLVGIAAILGIGMAVVLGRFVVDDPYDHLPFTIATTFLVSTWLTTLLAVVAGTLLFTSEVQHGTFAVSLTTQSSKRVLIAAKTVVAAVLGLMMGVAGIVGGLLGGLAGGMDTGDMTGVVTKVAWALLLTATAAVLGLGVGLIVRHSAGAVTGVLVWALAVETLVRGMAPARVSRLLPFSAAHGLLGTRSAADDAATLAAALSNVGNAAVIIGWALATVAIGAALVQRQDA